MTDERQHRRTHLFTVRLWVEQLAPDQMEVRGKVQHVQTGDVRYFREWPELIAFYEKSLEKMEILPLGLEDDIENE